MNNFFVLIIAILITSLVILLEKKLGKPECEHAEQTYFDASGEELSGDQTEACFSKCRKCGKKFIIPSGFQSSAHLENFLYEEEQAALDANKKRID